MFSYYGSKSKIISSYPEPQHPLIIEPFAGSARYALRYWDRDVWINDKYEVVADIWRWIQRATPADVHALPELKHGEDLRDYKQLSPVERNLLGFAVNMGVPVPHHICSNWAATNKSCGIPQLKKNILRQLERIRHWTITCVDYQELPNTEATWFIDPPYQQGGHRYPCHAVAYPALAAWCRDRQGQAIVCEHNGADWLPFRPLCKTLGRENLQRENTEYVWTNN